MGIEFRKRAGFQSAGLNMGREGFGRERLAWRESLRKTTLFPDLKPFSAFYAL